MRLRYRRPLVLALLLSLCCVLTARESGAADPQAPAPGCRRETLTNVVAQNQVDLGLSAAKTVANGMLLLAARGSKPVVLAGSAVLLAVELPGLAKALADARELAGLQKAPRTPLTDTPEPLVEICPASPALARAFKFEHMSIVGPPGVASEIAREEPSVSPAAPPKLPSGLSRPSSPFGFTLEAYRQEVARLQPEPHRSTSLSAALLAQGTEARPPQTPPAPVPPTWWRQPPATLTGTVFDADSRRALAGATVSLTMVTAPAVGTWQTAAALDDGTFAFRVLGGEYLVSVAVPGYHPYTMRITLDSGVPRDLPVALARESRYPCDFTVVNQTGWKIDLYFDDGGPPEPLLPWSSARFTLRRFFRLYPVAQFRDAPPLRWGEVPADCEGAGFVKLWP